MKKLVRDRIIEFAKDKFNFEKCHKESYFPLLLNKLVEEAEEVQKNPCAEELADVLEVVYTIAQNLNISKDELEKYRLAKKLQNGGLEEGYTLDIKIANKWSKS